MSDMEKAFKGMQTDVEGMKNALTADIKELKETQIPLMIQNQGRSSYRNRCREV